MKEEWYVVKTTFNKERKLEERIKTSMDNILRNIVQDVLVPTTKKVFMKSGKRSERETLIIPGYIYVKSSAPAELKTFLLNSKMGYFLTDRANRFQTISENEISKLKGTQQEIEEFNSTNYFVGEKVSIIDGPFSSMKGEISHVDGNKIKVNVSIFDRITVLELSSLQVERY